MPSSGSTTSRMASVMASAGVSVSLMGSPCHVVLRQRSLGDRVLEGHPAEQRALDASRIARDTDERDGILEHVLIGLALPPRLHEAEELLPHGEAVLERLPDD